MMFPHRRKSIKRIKQNTYTEKKNKFAASNKFRKNAKGYKKQKCLYYEHKKKSMYKEILNYFRKSFYLEM